MIARILSLLIASSVVLLGADFVPASRLIDWSTAGVRNGLMTSNRTLLTNLSAYAGTSDDIAAVINTLANSTDWTESKYIYLPAGTYTMSTACDIRKDNVVVRGDGIGRTIINGSGASPYFRLVGSAPSYSELNDPSKSMRLVSGLTKGSTNVIIHPDDVGEIDLTGLWCLVDQHNDFTNVGCIKGSGGAYTSSSRSNGVRALNQMVHVNSQSGSNIYLDQPLYWPFFRTNLAPEILQSLTTARTNCGYEGFTFNPIDTYTGGHVVQLLYCVDSWVKEVEIHNAYKYGMSLMRSSHCTIQGCSITNRWDYNYSDTWTSDNCYGIWVNHYGSDCLIMDNIISYMRHNIAFEFGGPGHVVAYNYLDKSRDADVTGQVFLMGALITHAAFQHFLLYEGNVTPIIFYDPVLGTSAGHCMALRNWSRGFSWADPLNNVYANTYRRAYDVAATNLNMTAIGNIFLTSTNQTSDVQYYADAGGWTPDTQVAVIEYGDTGNPSTARVHERPKDTLIDHLNYNYFTNGIVVDGTYSTNGLALSYLYPNATAANPPSWWPSYKVWPPFDPWPGTNGSPRLTRLPAEDRYIRLTNDYRDDPQDPGGPTDDRNKNRWQGGHLRQSGNIKYR